MSQDVNAVNSQSAATGTEVNNSAASQNNNSGNGEPDLEMELAVTQEALKKAIEEKDNYRQGMLKYKKGNTHQDDNDEGGGVLTAEAVEAIFERKLKDSQVVELQRKSDALLQQALRERKEALLALKNKSGISNAASGAGSTGTEKNDVRNAVTNSTPIEQYFTPAQIAHFQSVSKQTGVKVDLNKVRENMERRRAAMQ